MAVREASRAVSADYANYSAHLFLANSYEAQRRAGLSNLRLETAAISESILASLLGPASGTLLAQQTMQLQSSRLIEKDGVGLIANTEYLTRGAWRHSSAQYGTFGPASYSLEAEYVAEPSERRNQDYEIQQLEAKVKYDLTPRDSLLVHVLDLRANGGDTLQHFDEGDVNPTFRFEEEQSPRLLAGYRHTWSPQSQTLILAGRTDDMLETEDAESGSITKTRTLVPRLLQTSAGNESRSHVEVYSAEAQQITLVGRQNLIAGARIEFSEQKVSDFVANAGKLSTPFPSLSYPISAQQVHVDAYSAAFYVYDYITLTETLRAVGGLNYTYQEIPVNTGREPITSDREQQQQLSPKAGVIWSPVSWFDLRGSYTRSLLGFGLNQSIRLEPTHVAGLVQTFRGAVPPALVGDLDGADLETSEVVWEARFPETYLSVGWQRLAADKIRRSGLFLTQPGDTDFDSRPSRSSIREKIDFTEQSLELSAHRLVNKEWSFGTRYRLSYAELDRRYLDYNESLFVEPLERRNENRAWLHTVELSALYRHQNGLFVQVDGTWFSQQSRQRGPDFAGDDFWQLNLKTGYRFPNQRAELTLGVLNVLGTDYSLDPLNAHSDLPRSRTFYFRLLLNF